MNLSDLKTRVIAARAAASTVDTSHTALLDEFSALAREVGEVTDLRNARVKFVNPNGYDAILRLSRGPDGYPQFTVESEDLRGPEYPLSELKLESLFRVSENVQQLCTQLLQDEAEAQEAAVRDAEERNHALHTVRAVRESLNAPPSEASDFISELAAEAADNTITNLKVMYEGLLTALRDENRKLLTRIIEQTEEYNVLAGIAEDVFCGSSGDVSEVNRSGLDALYRHLFPET